MNKIQLIISAIILISCKIDTDPSIIVFVGDSTVCGYSSPTESCAPADLILVPSLYTKVNLCVGGIKMAWLDSIVGQSIVKYNSNYQTGNNILVIQIGINDLATGGAPLEIFSLLQQFCVKYRLLGFKVIVATLPSSSPQYGGIERLEYNSLIRDKYRSFADGLIDLGLDKRIGLIDSYLNLTYFNGSVHLTKEGYGVIAQLLQAVLDKYFDQ